MTTGVRTVRVLSVVGVLACGSVAVAQPVPPAAQPAVQSSAQPSTADRDQARQFAMEGITASNRADWPTVLDRFQRAEHLFHAPIHMRFMAIAYERTNHLREAAETWQRLSQETLPADAPEPFRQAVAEAAREYPRLRDRLGQITLTITDPPADARVELDGRGVEPAQLSGPILVDPGPHHVVGHAAGQPDVDRTVTVAVGATETVAVAFVPPHRTDAEPLPPPPVRTTTVYRANPLRTVGIVIASVGAAAAVGGIITGVMASSNYSTLQTNCPNMQCATADQLAQRDTVNSLAGATNGLLIGGAVLAVGGAILAIVSGPRAETVQVAAGTHGFDLAVHF